MTTSARLIHATWKKPDAQAAFCVGNFSQNYLMLCRFEHVPLSLVDKEFLPGFFTASCFVKLLIVPMILRTFLGASYQNELPDVHSRSAVGSGTKRKPNVTFLFSDIWWHDGRRRRSPYKSTDSQLFSRHVMFSELSQFLSVSKAHLERETYSGVQKSHKTLETSTQIWYGRSANPLSGNGGGVVNFRQHIFIHNKPDMALSWNTDHEYYRA